MGGVYAGLNGPTTNFHPRREVIPPWPKFGKLCTILGKFKALLFGAQQQIGANNNIIINRNNIIKIDDSDKEDEDIVLALDSGDDK